MTKEEAVKEVEKAFESAFANYIITALTEGATVSDKEPTTKNDLVVDWESYKDVDGNSLDDLILEVLQNNFDCGNTYGYKVADEVIGLLPSVTLQEPRWNPVTERLPEEGYSVLVMRITDDSYKYMRVATYQGDCWMDDTDKFNKPNPHKVIAWMPLPQPYKAESEEG